MPIFSEAISSSLPKNYVNMPEGTVTNIMSSGMKYGADPAQKVATTIVNVNRVSDQTAQSIGPNFDRFSVLSNPSNFNVRGNYFGAVQDLLPISTVTSTFGNNFITDELSQINGSNLLRNPKSELKTLANNLYGSVANEAKQTLKSAARSVVQDIKDVARGAVNSFLNPDAAKTTNLGVTDSRLSYAYFGPITAHKTYTQGKAKDATSPVFFKGVEPVLNPYYVFRMNLAANRNSAGGDSELQSKLLLDKEFRDGINSFNKKEVTLTNILEKYGKSSTQPYRAADFLWLKYYNKIPLNRLVTLRRYMFPINDDIQLSPYFQNKFQIQGWSNNPVSQMVTYFGANTGNSLSDILKIAPKTGTVVRDSKTQYINLGGGQSIDALKMFESSTIGKFATEKIKQAGSLALTTAGFLTGGVAGKAASAGLGAMKGVTSGLTAKDLSKGLLALTGIVDPARATGLERFRDTYNPYDTSGYLRDIFQKPYNVIDKVTERSPGLSGGVGESINLTFTYSLKSIGHLNAKAVMLDIMANILATCHYRGNFWGGEARFFLDKGIFPILDENQTLALVKGFWSGDFKSATSALKNTLREAFGKDVTFKQIIDLITKNLEANTTTPANEDDKQAIIGSTNITGPNNQNTETARLLNIPLGQLEDYALYDLLSGLFGMSAGGANAALPSFQALRTGAPTGEWHMTVGNPFNPIARMGNLICTGVTITFNDSLGSDDFPTEMKAVVALTAGLPRANQDIESVFNDGHGALYIPKATKDKLPSIEEMQESTARAVNQQGISNDLNSTPAQFFSIKAQTLDNNERGASSISPHISRDGQNDAANSSQQQDAQKTGQIKDPSQAFNDAKESAKTIVNELKSTAQNFGINSPF